MRAGHATAVARDETWRAIEAAAQAFVAAFARGDAAGVARWYTEDAQLMPPNMEVARGRTAIEETWKGFVASGLSGLSLTTSEVESHGDTAIEVGTYELKNTAGEFVDRGKFIVVWKRTGDAWQVHRDIFNSSLPPATR